MNKTIQTNALRGLRELPENFVDCIVTSPPYWGLRDYGPEAEDIWDGDANCDHDWTQIVKSKSSGLQGTEVKVYGGQVNQQISGTRKDHVSNVCNKCNAWRGQLGLEPTYQLFVQHLIQIFDECYRVLKPTGTCFVNIGDSYYGAKGKSGSEDPRAQEERYQDGKTYNRSYHQPAGKGKTRPQDMPQVGVLKKSLCQIPARFSIAMTDRNWILRNEIIWWKRNTMPSSVKDRFTVDFEKLFFFVKSRKYFFEQQFDPANYDGRKELFYKGGPKDMAGGAHKRWQEIPDQKAWNDDYWWNFLVGQAHPNRFYQEAFNVLKKWMTENQNYDYKVFYEHWKTQMAGKWNSGTLEEGQTNKLKGVLPFPKPETRLYGRNKRCVWDIPTRPLTDAHYAAYPEQLVEICIKAGCPEGGLVLDPFGGSGTTGIVARKLHCNYLLFEMVSDYIAIRDKRAHKHLGFFQ